MRLLLSALGAALCANTLACEGLSIEHAWLRQPPPGADVAAAYFEALNNGDQALTIQAVSSPDFKGAMLHTTRMVDGHAEMRAQGDVELAPGARFSAAPGGAHVMLFGPTQSVSVGQTLRLELRCAHGTPLQVALPVRRDAPLAEH